MWAALPPSYFERVDYRLHVFRVVAEQLNFTRAAARLHISQPAVTQHIKLLEEHYGLPLFRRAPEGISLTPSGCDLLEHARTVARLDERIDQEIRSRRGVVSGRLQLGASSTVSQYLLPEWLVRSRRLWPDLALGVTTGNTEDVITALLARKIDLGLIEGACRRADLTTETFLRDEMVCVAAPGHRLAAKAKPSLREVVAEPLVAREPGSGTREVVEEALAVRKIPASRLRIDLELSSSEAIKSVVASGHGVAFLSRFTVAREVAAGRLRVLPIPGWKVFRPLRFVYPKGPRPGGAAGAFIALVLEAGATIT